MPCITSSIVTDALLNTRRNYFHKGELGPRRREFKAQRSMALGQRERCAHMKAETQIYLKFTFYIYLLQAANDLWTICKLPNGLVTSYYHKQLGPH